MRRREFIAAFCAAAAWHLPAYAQQQTASTIARIGFLRGSAAPEATMVALRNGLADHGYLEGQHYVLLTSWGDGKLDRLPELARALVSSNVDVILTDGTLTARAARSATDTCLSS